MFIAYSTKLAYTASDKCCGRLGTRLYTALRHTAAIPTCQRRRMQANIQFVRIVLAWRKIFLTVVPEYHECYYTQLFMCVLLSFWTLFWKENMLAPWSPFWINC